MVGLLVFLAANPVVVGRAIFLLGIPDKDSYDRTAKLLLFGGIPGMLMEGERNVVSFYLVVYVLGDLEGF